MSEKELHLAVCAYIKMQFPKVIFTSDLSGLKLTIGQSVQVKKMRSSNGIPDILIFKPNKEYHGLFIELKKDGARLFKKDGNFVSDHIKEQVDIKNKLLSLGYFADIAIGFDEAKKLIDAYMAI